MQYHAIPCNAMQYHASLITADGAYHCPVGSIRPFFWQYGHECKAFTMFNWLNTVKTLSVMYFLLMMINVIVKVQDIYCSKLNLQFPAWPRLQGGSGTQQCCCSKLPGTGGRRPRFHHPCISAHCWDRRHGWEGGGRSWWRCRSRRDTVASPGEEREGERLTHLVDFFIWTLGIDDLLVQLLGTSLQLVVVFHNKAVELKSVSERIYVAIMCLDQKAIWQLLTKGPASSSCKIIIVTLKLDIVLAPRLPASRLPAILLLAFLLLTFPTSSFPTSSFSYIQHLLLLTFLLLTFFTSNFPTSSFPLLAFPSSSFLLF